MNTNMTVPAKERRRSVLTRLEAQLKSGRKPEKVDGKSTTNLIQLGEKDIKRITKEMETLKNRV